MPIQASPDTSQLLKLSGPADGGPGRLGHGDGGLWDGQASNAASEGCHSTRQLVMSDKQTTMSNDALEKIVCLRNTIVERPLQF